jgi:TolB-like protein
VIARTSAFAFRGREEDIQGIADALGVLTILQGSDPRFAALLAKMNLAEPR